MSNEEVLIPTTTTKSEVKLPGKKNVIPITSLSDLGTVVGDIHNQICELIEKLDNDVSPEFKALMEGYVKKANETEELKVNLGNITSKYEEQKTEILKIRETNRTLIHELQNAREVLKKLESELSTYQSISKKNEEEYKERIKFLTGENEGLENELNTAEEEQLKIKEEIENKYSELTKSNEKLRQELLDQKFKFHQSEQELIIERDNLKKQFEELDSLLKEQAEKLELKSKEADYKDALLNQFIKQTTTDKLKIQEPAPLNLVQDKPQKKRKFWPFG